MALTLTVVALNIRFAGDWGRGIHFVYTAAASLFVVMLAVNGPKGGERPAVWHSMLFVTGYALTGLALLRLADILGSNGGSGTWVWVGLLLIALTASFSTTFNSGVSTLLGALTAIVVALTLVDFVFHPHGTGTFRWILLLVALALAGGGAARRASAPDHAVGFVNAAGVALLVLALTFVGESFRGLFGGLGRVDAGTGWELIVLVGAAALAAYTAVERRSGPGYLAAANFAAFLGLAASPGKDGASLIGWPIVLVIVTGALIAAAMAGARGARPAPD